MTATWQTKRLGDLCDIELGRTPARANKSYWDHDRETNNVWLSIADLADAEENLVTDSREYLSDKGAALCEIVKKGTLLVSFKLTLGRLAFTGRDLYTNEAIAALNLREGSELSKEFLFYFLQFFDWRKAAEGDVKIKGMTLNKAKLKEIDVRFPALPEQRRIVGILDKAFAAIATAKANTEKNLQNARALFQRKLESLFNPDGNKWAEKTLAEVSTDFGRGKSKHRPRNDPKLYGGKYPFIQTGDVRNAAHTISSHTQTYNDRGLAQSKLWPMGTVCVTIAANIAETAVLGFDACFPDSVIGIVPDESKTSSEFVEYMLQSFKIRLQALGKGSAQDNINLGILENQRFPFPSLAVQGQIVSTLKALQCKIQRLEELWNQRLAGLEGLKRSLLDQAFCGAL